MAELQREEITARIKQARKEAGLNQPEMADLLEVAPRTYQNYESTRVPWPLIGKISEVTGKSTRWLLHGEDEPEQLPAGDLLKAFNNRADQLDRVEGKLDELLELLGSSGEARRQQLREEAVRIGEEEASRVRALPPAGRTAPADPQPDTADR